MLEHWKTRFLEHMERHPGLSWETAEQRLSGDPQALETLRRMEASGGEPDTLGWTDDGRLLFCDCAPESPAGRRSLCYDEEARRSRRKNPPVGSAAQQAWEMGVELMPEALYLRLQTLGQFDLKSSSWIATPPDIRSRFNIY